ncbi:MAG TPA: response regulator [Chthoniobacterales bacterium]|nr:response regulator [Chthoniobacterales bacterium]
MTSVDPDPVHFLLVDDLEGNLLSLEGLLRREGLVLLKASSGTEALELLLKHEVALAILDVQMPGMDGFELAELMRGSERTRRVPIIFLTAGNADRQRRFRGYEAGAVDFLHKPIEPDILRSKADVFYELFLQRRQIARQRDALELADRRKDEFLAVLAHELRNPLTPIRYGLDMMRMSPGQAPAEDMQAMMDRQLTHLVRLIDDLMDVSRISRGKIDLRKAHISLQAALQSAIEASRPFIESRRHALTLDIPEEPLWLDADATRISQVISNLLNNAAKYTSEGGQIGLSVNPTGNQVFISITDNGIGIPEEMLPRIFDLFTQVEKRGERSRGGLGIGLALARQLVELHQGTLEASSAGNGQGSTFVVQLPLAANAATPVPEPTQRAHDQTPLRMLVVDDNVSSAETTGRILSMVGHEITLAHNGPDALRLAREIAPDVIMLDIGMPGMSGYEVCRELRSAPAFKDTVFIAQTGWGQERDRLKTREAGFDHHLTKPVNFHELAELLAKV